MIEYKVEKFSDLLEEKFNQKKVKEEFPQINSINREDVERVISSMYEERLRLENLARERNIQVELSNITSDWDVILREGYLDSSEISLDNIAEELREEYLELMD